MTESGITFREAKQILNETPQDTGDFNEVTVSPPVITEVTAPGPSQNKQSRRQNRPIETVVNGTTSTNAIVSSASTLTVAPIDEIQNLPKDSPVQAAASGSTTVQDSSINITKSQLEQDSSINITKSQLLQFVDIIINLIKNKTTDTDLTANLSEVAKSHFGVQF